MIVYGADTFVRPADGKRGVSAASNLHDRHKLGTPIARSAAQTRPLRPGLHGLWCFSATVAVCH